MASKLMPSLLLIVLAWIIMDSCAAAADQKDVLSKLDELQETINGLTDMTSSKKKEIAGKVGKIFNVIRYFKAGGEYTGAGIFKTVEVLGDLLEVSGVLSTGLPWMGPLISQICSGVIHVFYNPSSRDIFVKKLREQYMKELKDDGAGVFEVLTSLDMELRFIQDKVSEGTPWDEVAKSTFKSLQDRARYDNIDIYLGKLRSAIQTEFQEKKASVGVYYAMEHTMGLIRLYCDVVAMLEALYHRMILVVRVGQSPELMNYTDLPRKLKDYWLDSLRRKAKIFLKFIYLPDKTDYYQSTVYHRLRSSGNEDAWGVGKAMDALGVSPKRFDIGDIVTVQVYSSSPRTDTTITYSPTTKSLETVPMAGDGGALDQQWEVQHGVTEHGYSLRNMATRQFIFPGRNISRSIADHLLGRATNKGTTIELIEIDPLDCGQSERNGSCFRISDYQWNFKKSRMGHTKSFELYSTTGGVAFIIHTVRNASDNDYIESVRHYTVNFKQCKPDSKCSRRGYSYSWCRYNKFNRYDWDYCSMEQGYTYHGIKCLQGICNPSMSLSAVPKLYFWCYTSKDLDWDYCSVQDPIVYRRALDAQLNQTISGFPCLGPCQSNNRCVEAYSSQAFGENYCSLREGYSVGNKKCVDSCSRKKRSSYLYCNLEDGSWDYCSIERNKWRD